MPSEIDQGFIVLADISGFTAFMEANEIDHSARIIENFIQLIMKCLTPVMTIAEVEGDAVFAYTPAKRITRGELLLELIETTYAAFRDRRQTMQHNVTCACTACQSISHLDLKFITHYGDYVLQDITGRPKPVGSSVNLAHRLLKNQLGETTGWSAYALFSEKSLAKLGVRPEGLHHGLETYPELVPVHTRSYSLDERYRQMVRNRTVFLDQMQADHTISFTFAASPPLVWDWLTDPAKRNRWSHGSAWSASERPQGRTGPSAQNHCSSSDATEEILDWRPFDYYTVNLRKGRFKMTITSALDPVDSGTRIQWHMKFQSRLPQWIRRRITRHIADKTLQLKDCFGKMAQLMAGPDPTA